MAGLCGAGFAGLYNTNFRMDRFTLQFFVRNTDENQAKFEKLPPPSSYGGNYLFDLDGRVYQYDLSRGMKIRWWSEQTGAWQLDESFSSDPEYRVSPNYGRGKMRVAGKVLHFKDNEVWYDGRAILEKTAIGHYYNLYYATGYMVFFHTNKSAEPRTTKLYAAPWTPGSGTLDLSKAITLDLEHSVTEVSFAIGQLNNEIIVPTNRGNVYAFNVKDRRWKSLLPLLKGEKSYFQQVYSILNWYDKLLMGTYPMGELFEYDGEQIRRLEGWPPRMKGVGGYGRESQTTCIYGGDLYVGLWPWSELWRYDAGRDKWHFVRRMFQHPSPDAKRWPWEEAIKDSNLYGKDLGFWGQRITGLVPMGDALYISVAARGCYSRDMRLEFLQDDEVWNEYRTVHRMRRPGCVAAAIKWTGKPTKLQFTVTDEGIVIAQDGRELASAPISAVPVDQLKDAEIQWGYGMFGPSRATIRSKAVGP